MKPHRLFITVVSVGFTLFGWSQRTSAQWPQPLSYSPSAAAAPIGMAGGLPGNCAPGGTAMPGGFRGGCSDGGCQLSYSDFAGDGCGSGGASGGLGGLASGCRPVGLLGQLGEFTGLGAGCGNNGYHPGAFAGGLFRRRPANPYGQYPGFGPDNAFTNLGDVCCGPHWYDVMVQAVFITREGDINIDLTSEGPRASGAPNIVLSTDDLDLELNAAFRIAGRLQTSAVTSIEAVYLGGLDWDDAARVVSNDNDLYSVYSDFGDDPLGGFEDTDQAAEHTVAIDSDFDSVEVNFRKGWIARHARTSGSWIIGARYMRLRDDFQFNTRVLLHDNPFPPPPPTPFGPGASQYDIATENDLVGAQIGGEFVQCIVRGFSIGGEAKVGAYGNSVEQNSRFAASQLGAPLIEGASSTKFTYSADGQVFVLWQFHPLAKVRAGYEVILVDGVATAYGNFNTAPPFGLRNVVLNDTEDLLLQGFHVGLEFGW